MPQPVPLKPTTVRFAEDGMDLVREATEKTGSNFGEFVREAAIMRAIACLREDSAIWQMDEELRAAEIKRLARRNDP